MKELELSFPEGMEYSVPFNPTTFIEESIPRGLQDPLRGRDPGTPWRLVNTSELAGNAIRALAGRCLKRAPGWWHSGFSSSALPASVPPFSPSSCVRDLSSLKQAGIARPEASAGEIAAPSSDRRVHRPLREFQMPSSVTTFLGYQDPPRQDKKK